MPATDVPSNPAPLIDHTLLRADATAADIERLCAEAEECGFAAACVNPAWVSRAARRLARSRVRVCSVVAFPLGATTTEVKVHEAERAIADGALEIDFVMNVGALKSGDSALAAADLRAVVSACRAGRAVSKVIIEASLLTEGEKGTACGLASDAGADYVKTSTGFGPGGATVTDVALIRACVGPAMGIKAAGGIRDYETVRHLVLAGATRIGTSAGVKILAEWRVRTDPPPSGSG
jgi:deoxyribose-phosphate aldolase